MAVHSVVQVHSDKISHIDSLLQVQSEKLSQVDSLYKVLSDSLHDLSLVTGFFDSMINQQSAFMSIIATILTAVVSVALFIVSYILPRRQEKAYIAQINTLNDKINKYDDYSKKRIEDLNRTSETIRKELTRKSDVLLIEHCRSMFLHLKDSMSYFWMVRFSQYVSSFWRTHKKDAYIHEIDLVISLLESKLPSLVSDSLFDFTPDMHNEINETFNLLIKDINFKKYHNRLTMVLDNFNSHYYRNATRKGKDKK